MPDPPELSVSLMGRWDVACSAMRDFADALRSGDEEGAAAAMNQLRHMDLDLARFRDSLHVPGDAGDLEDALTRLLLRIPDGWGRWIGCSRGWYPLIVRLDAQLAALDPEYTVHQVKEKFGGLRFYIGSEADPDVQEEMRALIDEAERASERICEVCGSGGELSRSAGGWYQTLCPPCRVDSDRGYKPLGDEEPGS
jgi:hypothetical protein